MSEFYWSLARSIPQIFWNSFLTIEGGLMALAFLLLLLNKELRGTGERILHWREINRRWALVPFGALFVCSVLQANYDTSVEMADRKVSDQRTVIESEIREEYQRVDSVAGYLGSAVYEWHVLSPNEGASVASMIGGCNGDYCLSVRIGEVQRGNGGLSGSLEISGEWGRVRTERGIKVVQEIGLEKGCEYRWGSSERTLKIVVIDDRFSSLRVAVGVVPGEPDADGYLSQYCPSWAKRISPR